MLPTFAVGGISFDMTQAWGRGLSPKNLRSYDWLRCSCCPKGQHPKCDKGCSISGLGKNAARHIAPAKRSASRAKAASAAGPLKHSA
jgi:hypothetical protein